jgi:hypothetical protein
LVGVPYRSVTEGSSLRCAKTTTSESGDTTKPSIGDATAGGGVIAIEGGPVRYTV